MKLCRMLKNKKGASDMVFKVVLAVTIAASVLIIMLQLLHQTQDTGLNATATVGEGLKNFAENVSRELSG